MSISTTLSGTTPSCDTLVQIIDLSGLSRGNGHRSITERETREIIEITDPAMRNLRITLGYHDILLGMARLIGERNLSWPAFACWASRTAGSFIRGEYVPASVKAFLDQLKPLYSGLHTAHRILTGVRGKSLPEKSLLAGIIERMSHEITIQVGWGNDMVFEDIAPHYAAMIDAFATATTYDQRALDRFLSRFRPGDVQNGGQDLLARAFTAYYRAIFEHNPKKKAELVLLGNNLIGFHEQSRLQPAIEKSMNAPIADLITRTAQDRARELTHRRMHGWVDRQIDRLLDTLSLWIKHEWESIATSWYMHLQLPDESATSPDEIVTGKIKVGVDVPPRSKHRPFPSELTQLQSIELKALLYDLDRTPNTLENSRPDTWARLGDRMNFLVDLFRAMQQKKELYLQPFTDVQIADIRRGEMPDGNL